MAFFSLDLYRVSYLDRPLCVCVCVCVCVNEVIDLAVILGKIDLFWHSVIGV